MKAWILSPIAVLLSLGGCSVKTYTPAAIEDIEICADTDRIISTIKSISYDKGLSFHYGTSRVSYGTQMTFRLIGNGIEIELFNYGKQSTFTLRSYDTSKDHSNAISALKAFKDFKYSIGASGLTRCGTGG